MTRPLWGAVVYGPILLVWLAFELTSVFWRGCPWPTLSRLCWDMEDAWPPVQVAFLVFLAALLVHIISGTPLWLFGSNERTRPH